MTKFGMLKDEQNRSYNGGGDARPLKIWSDFSSIQYRNISILQSELGPSDLAIFFLLSLLSVVPRASGLYSDLFSGPGIYVETYVCYDMYI